jgi:hypothetical protein
MILRSSVGGMPVPDEESSSPGDADALTGVHWRVLPWLCADLTALLGLSQKLDRLHPGACHCR